MPRGTATERILDALRRNDEQALGELLPPLRERLLHLAKERLTNDARAEEVVQETLGTFWEKRRVIREPEHVLPFLYSILRNKIGNAYLRERRRLQVAQAQGDIERHAANPDHANPELLAQAGELDRILVRAVRKCAREHELWGRVLRMLGEGRNTEEIRQRLGSVPLGTVHSTIHRARRRLREILEQDFVIRL